ncbi:hypothetical protein CHUAL_001049, partial [Chamberlinius hualienensis]
MSRRIKPDIPPELQGLLLEFTVEVLLEKPDDLLDFAVEYFTRIRAQRKNCDAEQQQRHIRPAADSDESMLTDDDDDQDLAPPPTRSCGRRKSVFAEHYNPEEDEDDVAKQVFPKTDEQRKCLSEAVKEIFLFRSLDQ